MPEVFSRYEFKYVLAQSTLISIQRDIRNFMRHDEFVESKGSSSYVVRSLYFDNARWSNFYEKVDGVKLRRKFRIRTYGQFRSSGSPVFLECKSRNNNRVSKVREQLSYQECDEICKGRSDYLNEESSMVRYNFCLEMLRKRISPKVVIDYVREPYVSDHDGKFRVTFDSDLTGIANSSIWDAHDAVARWASLLPEKSIMEVKFNRRVPAWFHRIIQAYELDRVSVSKYVLGVKRLQLAVDLS